MSHESLIEPETSGNAHNDADEKGASALEPWLLHEDTSPIDDLRSAWQRLNRMRDSCDSGYASLNTSPALRKNLTDPPARESIIRYSITSASISAATSLASMESSSSEHTPSPSPENDAWLIMAYAKHRTLVFLMSEVYGIFNSQWSAELRSRTASQAPSSGASSQGSSSRTPTPPKKGKRQMEDRGSQSPDINNTKKRKTGSGRFDEGSQGRLFACCFHKYNPQKYCSNSETGTKFRSCEGPGFSKISQLKQHLRRNHRAPIYCTRCWLVMTSQAEMTLHANVEERCERKEPQVQEGVDPDKMRMITETWGISWEEIYEILFPGAPTPSPYYDAHDLTLADLEPSSPRSQELRDFEAYNRTTLPLLVEANLRAIVESQIAPIEERVRAMVVDVVRTCQSTVARNFYLMVAPASSTHDRTQPSTQTTASTEAAAQSQEESTQAYLDDTGETSSSFFREPPHLNAEAGSSFPGPISSIGGSQNPYSDSGYSSLPCSCSCSCHDYSNTWNTANGRSSCQSCDYMHFDFDLEFDDFWNKDGNAPGSGAT